MWAYLKISGGYMESNTLGHYELLSPPVPTQANKQRPMPAVQESLQERDSSMDFFAKTNNAPYARPAGVP